MQGRWSHCRAERLRAEALLQCVLQGAGLSYARLASGTYVLVTDPQTASQRGRLSGQVVDADTGIPLASANVLLAAAGGGTSTNEAGRFAFPTLKPGRHRVIITHVAYHDAVDTVRVSADGAKHVQIALRPRTLLFSPVVVSGLSSRLPAASLQLEERTAADRRGLTAAGATGVMQDLGAAVPGVQLSEGRATMHVQGGAAGDQAFRLEGAPVFTPMPSGGLVGSFSSLAVGRVNVRKAGFEAARGSHLAGVVDVHHRMPGEDTPMLAVQISPLSVDARLGGRLQGGGRTVSLMVAGRKSLWGLYQPGVLETLFRGWGAPDAFLLRALRTPPGSEEDLDDVERRLPASGSLDMNFSDLHAAGRVDLGGLQSLSASFYRGAGAFGVEGELGEDDDGPGEIPDRYDRDGSFKDRYDWTSYAAHLTYEAVLSGRFFARAEAWGASYTFGHAFNAADDQDERSSDDDNDNDDDSGNDDDADDDGGASSLAPGALVNNFNELRELGVRLSGDYAWTDAHLLSGAVEAAFTEGDFALSLRPDADPVTTAALAPAQGRVAGFVEDEVTLGERWRLTPGLRLTYVPAHEALYSEPRLALRYDRPSAGGGAWGARVAVGRYRQFRSSFDVPTAGTAALFPRVRYWLPIGQRRRPPEAYHAALSALYRPGGSWTVRAEGYYKQQPRLRVLASGRPAETHPPSTEALLFAEAEGYAYGFSLKGKRTAGRLQGEAYYEYTVARRRVEGRFGERLLPAPWSAPHRLHVGLEAALTSRLTATLRWKGLFGRTWGFRQAYYDLLAPRRAQSFPPFDFSRPDRHPLPAFSQWDVGLAYTREVGGVQVQAQAALINALGRDNVTSWSMRPAGNVPDDDDEWEGTYERDPRLAVPRYPSFSVKVSW